MQLARNRGRLALLLFALLSMTACQRSAETSTADAEATRAMAAPDAVTAVESTPTAVVNETLPEGVLHAYVWECDGDLTLNVRNLFRERAVTLVLHEGERKLPLVPGASGARYADETVSFWTKGREATFERQGSPPVTCREVRARSLLADARVRGVRYRGTGNEPGWLVEIGPGTSLLYVASYGQERHEFDGLATGGPDAGGVTFFTARHADQEIKVTVAREACIDDMSGAEFDHRMVVDFAGQSLRGCAATVQ